ncbi:MAG TPA: TIGR02391 family protein [Anaerolineales bacterium]|nr:TIGR02391 family protein [Anaerolineales bacterium]
MFLTNDEMQILRDSVEAQAGYDEELIKTCSHLIHIKAFDEAVRNAFVLLEDRLRKVLNKRGATGFQMAQYAFSPNGPFTKLLSQDQLEYEGTRDLFYGAFRLYRNPSAHNIIGYNAGEARSIISLVNLLLTRIDYLSSVPQPGTFSDNLEQALSALEKKAGTATVTRIRIFLSQCEKLNMHPSSTAKVWIPFRKHALVKSSSTKEPGPQKVTVFYLSNGTKEQGIWFPINQYWSTIVDLDRKKVLSRLKELGFQPMGKAQDPYISLDTYNSQTFLENLYKTVELIGQDFDGTLK